LEAHYQESLWLNIQNTLIITSLKLSEAQEAVNKLEKEFPEKGKNYFIPWGGDIFVRNEYKEMNRFDIISDPVKRHTLMQDIMEELSEEILKSSSLYNLITLYRPEIIIDCINSATRHSISGYLYNLQKCSKAIRNKSDYNAIVEETEKMLCTLYIPQLIRHIQLLYSSMGVLVLNFILK